MAPLTALIVDDEAPARQLLTDLLADEPEITILGECANGFEAVRSLQETKPDLLFLDVQMPKLSGFEVLELVPTPPAVIFTTAYDQYALQAFEVHAVDFLLKPFSAERLHAAIERARQRLGQQDALAGLVDAVRRQGLGERILVPDGERVHVVPVARVDYFEAQGDSVVLKVGNEKLKKSVTLSELETALDPACFLRVHRSYILNLDRLAGIELYAKDSRIALLRDGSKIPVSRAGYARLRERL